MSKEIIVRVVKHFMDFDYNFDEECTDVEIVVNGFPVARFKNSYDEYSNDSTHGFITALRSFGYEFDMELANKADDFDGDGNYPKMPLVTLVDVLD